MHGQEERGETSTKSFHDWAGGARVTLAIVFTDVVGSTALSESIREEAMGQVRRAHFAQSRKLTDRAHRRKQGQHPASTEETAEVVLKAEIVIVRGSFAWDHRNLCQGRPLL